jgi:hypothetical protein
VSVCVVAQIVGSCCERVVAQIVGSCCERVCGCADCRAQGCVYAATNAFEAHAPLQKHRSSSSAGLAAQEHSSHCVSSLSLALCSDDVSRLSLLCSMFVSCFSSLVSSLSLLCVLTTALAECCCLLLSLTMNFLIHLGKKQKY